MIKIILLLSPAFVSLFWAITLTGNKKHSSPQLFLSKLMLVTLVIFTAHFIYFSPFPQLYPYFDFAYQYAGSMILPAYYIYFRLLTVDKVFTFKAHAKYLIIPAFPVTLYCICAILTPGIQYTTWLFNEQAFPDSPYIKILGIMHTILRIQFLLLVVFTAIGNQLLLRKYNEQAEQFYSDINDGKYNNAKLLNYSIIVLLGVSFISVALGKRLLVSNEYIIYSAWSISTVMLYYIGYMGFKQKPINPTYELHRRGDNLNHLESISIGAQKKILDKILVEFDEKKIYLNNNLNIMDVVQAVGTNRTYISAIINQHYNQNFCSFVNSYRVEELERVLLENPNCNNETLAVCCGFGSIISLRRAVSAKTGLSLTSWKNQIIESRTMNKSIS